MLDRLALKLRLKALDKAQVVQGHENAALEEIAAEMLDGVEAEGRALDAWEANCLHAALEAMRKHRFGLARANLLHALETVRHSLPGQRPRSDIARLKAALADIAGLPPKGVLKTHGSFELHHL